MNTAVHLINQKKEKANCNKRHCSIQESLAKSLKEVKLIKEGKLEAKTWNELYDELEENEEK